MGAAGRNSATAVAWGRVSFNPRFLSLGASAACVGARTVSQRFISLVCVVSLVIVSSSKRRSGRLSHRLEIDKVQPFSLIACAIIAAAV